MTSLREIYFMCDMIDDNNEQDVYIKFIVNNKALKFKLYDEEFDELYYNELRYDRKTLKEQLVDYKIYSDTIVDYFMIKTDYCDEFEYERYVTVTVYIKKEC